VDLKLFRTFPNFLNIFKLCRTLKYIFRTSQLRSILAFGRIGHCRRLVWSSWWGRARRTQWTLRCRTTKPDSGPCRSTGAHSRWCLDRTATEATWATIQWNSSWTHCTWSSPACTCNVNVSVCQSTIYIAPKVEGQSEALACGRLDVTDRQKRKGEI